MNLTRVLNNALPDLPARALSQLSPRVPPDAVFREHLEGGELIVRVLVPGQDAMYSFPSQNWDLSQLFDGRRSFEDIAEMYSGKMGREYSPAVIRDFAASLEAMNFWYKTPQEKNIQLMQQTANERRKLLKSRKSKFGDLSEITFPAFKTDKFISWLYRYTSFVYTWWFTLLTLAAFGFATWISVAHWSEIGRDTVQFYNFTEKSWGDVAVFYLLALIILGLHELGHGHACKHYGGRVPEMGFLLIYLTPAFYTDTSEGFVKGSRYQRFIIAMAGVWAELWVYALVTPIWWGTPPGTDLHDVAYLMMLMSGIAGLLLNWNPLMKLDGYYMLSEVLEISDLKESSTAYVSAWVKRNIWSLPVDVPFVPKRRRLGFAVYALLSGAYSYTVLYVFARFVGNVFRNFNPEWSFVPELATAALIFRSRIRTLVNFMKFIYLDKKDRIKAWFGIRRVLAVALFVGLILILPLWHESALGRFALEPAHRAVVRNLVPGTVVAVFTSEASSIDAGAPLVRLRNISMQSRVAESETESAVAAMRANAALLQYANLGSALAARNREAQKNRELESQYSDLVLTSSLSGTVLTPRLSDRIGTYVPAGTNLVEIGDLSEMRARVYISDHDFYKIRVGSPARLQVDGFSKKWDATAMNVAPVSSEMDPGLADQTKYKGMNPPRFYLVEITVSNPQNELKAGMLGMARIYGQRRSLAGLMWQEMARFFGRKVW